LNEFLKKQNAELIKKVLYNQRNFMIFFNNGYIFLPNKTFKRKLDIFFSKQKLYKNQMREKRLYFF